MLTVILTGGQSRRMGRDKALLPTADGDTMSGLLIKKYSSLGTVALAVDKKGHFPDYGALELEDTYPGRGPLNGIISAFRATGEQFIFLTATDLPNGTAAIPEKLRSLIGDHDACVIRRNGQAEPLMAVYRRSCLEVAEECMRQGKYAMKALLDGVSVRYVSEDELPEMDLRNILRNINTPEEYEAWK